jgi:hypothetical protein
MTPVTIGDQKFVKDANKGWVDSKTKQQCYIELPTDTNTFGWSNGRVLHGSDYRNKRKLLLIVNAVQCPIKTETLLENSLAKYKNQLNYSL